MHGTLRYGCTIEKTIRRKVHAVNEEGKRLNGKYRWFPLFVDSRRKYSVTYRSLILPDEWVTFPDSLRHCSEGIMGKEALNLWWRLQANWIRSPYKSGDMKIAAVWHPSFFLHQEESFAHELEFKYYKIYV